MNQYLNWWSCCENGRSQNHFINPKLFPLQMATSNSFASKKFVDKKLIFVFIKCDERLINKRLSLFICVGILKKDKY